MRACSALACLRAGAPGRVAASARAGLCIDTPVDAAAPSFFTRGLRALAYAFHMPTSAGANAAKPMDMLWIALTLALYAAVLGLVWFCDRLLQRN